MTSDASAGLLPSPWKPNASSSPGAPRVIANMLICAARTTWLATKRYLVCERAQCPSSCASTAVTCSSVLCSSSVSYNTMRLFLKKPYMYALLWALRRDPSTTKSFLSGNFNLPASASIFFFNLPSSSGWYLLKRGAMITG